MKKRVVSLLAAAMLAAGVPSIALAHDHLPGQIDDDDDWNNGGDDYGEFQQEYQHIWQGIEHGMQDGSYTPREASYFYRQMQSIRARAEWEERSGYYNPGEIQYRLEALHARMHAAHERGHERLDRYNDWNGYRGDYGYDGDRR